MWPFGWYGGINNGDDLKDCTPESFKFHGTFKSIARMIIPLLRTPQEWLDLNASIPAEYDILPTVTPAGIILTRAPPPPGAPGTGSRCVRANTSQREC